MTSDHGKILVSWKIDEFRHHHRPIVWYIGAVALGAALVVYALATLNFLFALIIVIFAIIITISHARAPLRLPVTMTEDGVEIGHRFVPWKEIERFWIIYEPPDVKNLYIDFTSPIRPRVSIPLEDTDPNVVRRALLAYVKEDLSKEDEPLSDFLGRMLRI